MNDEHSVGLTDPRIIQILGQTKEGRAKLQGWKERENTTQADDTQTLPGFSLKKLAGMLLFSVIISALMTFLMIGIIEVVRWIL
jgi:hypothetical protein